jgi:hypothetical protein
MTCKHKAGDRDCSSHPDHPDNPSNRRSLAEPVRDDAPATPDASKYNVEDVEQVGAHLVMRVKYPNCRRCAYEGNKVMVFLNVTLKAAFKWHKIDPHFRAPNHVVAANEAPSPAARFPGSDEGWQDALNWARIKAGGNR